MEPKRCATCVHCFVIEGQCRAKPPHAFIVPSAQGPMAISAWPPVQPHQWCGSYQRADESELESRTAEAVKEASGGQPKVTLA